MEKMTDSSIHSGEQLRQGLRTGLPGCSGVAGVQSGDMAPPLSRGKGDWRRASLNRSRHSGEKKQKKKQHEGQPQRMKAYFLNLGFIIVL